MKIPAEVIENIPTEVQSTIFLPDRLEDGVGELKSFDNGELKIEDCFEITYLMRSDQHKFTLYLQEFTNVSVQSFPLLQWIPKSQISESVQFCLQDFIHSSIWRSNLTKRFVISTQGNYGYVNPPI